MTNQKMILEFNLEDYDSQKQDEKSLKVQEICNRLLDFEQDLRRAVRDEDGHIISRIKDNIGMSYDFMAVRDVLEVVKESYYEFTESVRDLIED